MRLEGGGIPTKTREETCCHTSLQHVWSGPRNVALQNPPRTGPGSPLGLSDMHTACTRNDMHTAHPPPPPDAHGAPPEGTLSYCTCAQEAVSTKAQKENGSSVAYKTIGTLLSKSETRRCQWVGH